MKERRTAEGQRETLFLRALSRTALWRTVFQALTAQFRQCCRITSLLAAQPALRDRLLFIRRATALYSSYPVCVVWLTCTHAHRNRLLCARESIQYLLPFPLPSPFSPLPFPHTALFLYLLISYLMYIVLKVQLPILVFLMSYFDMMISSPIYFLANNRISCSSQLN